MIESSNLASIDSIPVNVIVFCVAALITIVRSIYVWLRFGSSIMLHDRMWRHFFGKTKFKSWELNKAWERVEEYERLVFSTGIRFHSYENAIETIKWLSSKRIGLEELIKVKRFFDCYKVEMLRPKVRVRGVVMWLFFIFLSLSVVIFSASMMIPGAVLRIKETNDLVWAMEHKAGLFFRASLVNKEICSTHNPEVKLNYNSEVLCDLLTSKDGPSYINKTVYSQRVFGFMLFVVFFFACLISGRDYLKSKDALDVYNRTKSKSKPEGSCD